MAKGTQKILRTGTTPGEVACPFRILIDSREQLPYSFRGMRTTKEEGSKLITIETITHGLPVGDYTIDGLPGGIIIERKSKADLFASMADRDNMEWRLGRMSADYHCAHWVIEAELSDIYRDPASQYNTTALGRSIIAWETRYRNVHWRFCPDRAFAERWTFRLLEKFHREATLHMGRRDHDTVLRTCYRRGVRDRLAGVAYNACPYPRVSAEEGAWDAGWRDLDTDLKGGAPTHA